MLKFACPCGKELRTPEEFAGRQTRCPACGKPVTVPSAAIQAAPAPMPVAEAELEPIPDSAGAPGTIWGMNRLALASIGLGLLGFCLPLLPAIGAVVTGILGLKAIQRTGGSGRDKGLAIGGLVAAALSVPFWCVSGIFLAGMISGAAKFASRADNAAQRIESTTNLQKIGLAMIQYHDALGQFPIADKNGLSWRVHLLPYLKEDKLYQQFKLDEPWDSPTNIKLLPQMPKVYVCPRFAAKEGNTYYRGFTGLGTVLGTAGGANLAAIMNANGQSNTIMVVEAGDAVPWTKPDELTFHPDRPLPPFGGPQREAFFAVFADGHVQSLRPETDPAILKKMIDWTNTQPFVRPQ